MKQKTARTLYITLTVIMLFVVVGDQYKARQTVQQEPHFHREDGVSCWNFDWRWERNLYCGEGDEWIY